MPHTARIPIRWSDLDALGHVNNATYLTYCEQARIEVLERLDPAWWTEARGPVVVQATLHFKRPITTTGVVLVEMGFGEPGRSSLKTTYRLALEADPSEAVAEAELTMVWIDIASGRPAEVPASLRAALAGAERGEAG